MRCLGWYDAGDWKYGYEESFDTMVWWRVCWCWTEWL